MNSYREPCLIGSVDFDPRRKNGSLNTSNKWKARLDRVWSFLGSEAAIPEGLTERERYWWIYTCLKNMAMRSAVVIGAIGLYLVLIRMFAS